MVSIIRDEEKFLVYNEDGDVYYSYDGVSWQYANNMPNNPYGTFAPFIIDFAAGKDNYIAIFRATGYTGDEFYGKYFISENGLDWKGRTIIYMNYIMAA